MRACHVRRLAHEGRRPGQAFVSDDSQCIQITGRRGVSSGYPLRRQVFRRPRHDLGGRAGHRADRMRAAPTSDLHRSAGGKQEVPRLDITVDQALGVRRLQAGRSLSDDVHGPRGIQETPGQHASQRGPVDQFHHQIGLRPLGRLVVVIDMRDVLVPQGRGVPRLGPEPSQGFRLLSVSGMQELDGDRP